MKQFGPLREVLEYLERELDAKAIAAAHSRVAGCLSRGEPGVCVSQCLAEPAALPFARRTLEEGSRDLSVMLYNELVGVCNTIARSGPDAIPSIRPNYGTGILPSLFGAKSRYLNPNELPWSDPVNPEDLAAYADRETAPLDAGYGSRVFETYSFFDEMLAPYPNVKRCVPYAHADLQGPFDVLHLLCGDQVYYDLYDAPEQIHALLDVITRTYIALLRRMLPYAGAGPKGCCYHWNTLYPGQAVIRDDSAVTLGREHYLEFSLPYIRQIIEALGGASVHYCGADAVWLPDLLKTEGLRGLNFGFVPGMEDRYGLALLDRAIALREDRPIALVSYPLSQEDFETLRRDETRKRVTCSILEA